jgi:hypothetical protein
LVSLFALWRGMCQLVVGTKKRVMSDLSDVIVSAWF